MNLFRFLVTKKSLLTIAAAVFLLIPGASAAPSELLLGDTDGMTSGDASGIAEFLICTANLDIVIYVGIVGDVSRCLAASGIAEFLICTANLDIVIYVGIVGDAMACLSSVTVVGEDVPDAGTWSCSNEFQPGSNDQDFGFLWSAGHHDAHAGTVCHSPIACPGNVDPLGKWDMRVFGPNLCLPMSHGSLGSLRL